MPVPTYSRQNHPSSPSIATISTNCTPSRVKHVDSTSTAPSNMSYSPTVTSGGLHQKLNVVTRVAIEGKATQDKDGGSIKMYLKISVPLDHVQPGATIPLFREENIKILRSYVHPLNSHSVPYNFSLPILHNAARALNLPARSTETFNSAFLIPSSNSNPSGSRTSTKTSGEANIPTVDAQYAGLILVSGYHISYVLPKAFPTLPKSLSETESEGYSKSRRLSIGERGSAQFMAAIDMWIPYASRPPRYPYLLSIPIPRCLHNNIKLRIFPPTAQSTSFASLSSLEEDSNSWDLTSDPHVTRSTSTRPRSNSYSHFADDESSDSSTVGFSDGCGIQGTFPSTERIRVRWAKPGRNVDIPGRMGDGRRRVGVKEVKGEMTCIVRGKQKANEKNGAQGLLMDIEYQGTCRGVWFPGVATLLGLDVGLETKGSDAYWVDGTSNTWDVNGGIGYTGFNVGASPRLGIQSRTASLDSNNSQTSRIHSTSLPSDSPSAHLSRNDSTSSLLRAPLPAQAVGEYSFEGSAAALSSVSASALASSSVSSLTPDSSSAILADPDVPPGLPITLHVNMNDIIAPAKDVLTFTISGTILVVARPHSSRLHLPSRAPSPGNLGDDDDNDPEPIVLPRFTVLAADSESTTTVIRNEAHTPATLEVYNPTGDIYRDAQAKKTVLQKGGFTKCTEGGSRIALRSLSSMNGTSNEIRQLGQRTNGPHTPTAKTSALPRIPFNPSFGTTKTSRRLKRDGPLMIPSVKASVTPLLRESELLPTSYAVRVCLDAPSDTDSEWMEFGLAQQSSDDLPALLQMKDGKPPRVVIVSAVVEGVSVRYETVISAKLEASSLGLAFEQMSGKEWISWVRIHVGPNGGGKVVIDYVVSERPEAGVKGKAKAKDDGLLHIFLPSFSIPVGRLEVHIESSGIDVSSIRSNFIHQQATSTGNRLLNYSMEGFFYPALSMTVRPTARIRTSWIQTSFLTLITWALIIVGFIHLHRLNEQQAVRGYNVPVSLDEFYPPESATIITTITSTIYTSTQTHVHQWEESTSTSEPTIPSSPTYVMQSSESSSSRSASATPDRASNVDYEHLPQSTPLIERYALRLPIQHFLNFTLPTHDFHATIERVMQAMGKVWYALQKAYHYPLDPP